VHREHRGHGYGRAISLAAAAALRELGASSATVCTPTSNVGAVATYASAGYERLPDVTDFRRTTDARTAVVPSDT
jgi:ribosomal protein S18 acetylase RimI-like enzyme